MHLHEANATQGLETLATRQFYFFPLGAFTGAVLGGTVGLATGGALAAGCAPIAGGCAPLATGIGLTAAAPLAGGATLTAAFAGGLSGAASGGGGWAPSGSTPESTS